MIDLSKLRKSEDVAVATLTAARDGAMNEVADIIATAANAITGPVSDAERASWGTKADAARAYAANPKDAAALAVLAPEADITGEEIATLVEKIAVNAAEYTAAIGALTGHRRLAARAIGAAKTPDDVSQAVGALRKALAG